MQQPGYGHQPPPGPPPGYGQQPPPMPPGYGPPPPGFGPPPPPYAPPAHPAPPYAPVPPQPVPAGPEFLAADRYNSVVVDGDGVFFETHGLSHEFPWPQVRSVHYRPSPSGKALFMAVVHADGQIYECTVDARRRDRLQQWFTELAPVLGFYRPMG